MWPLNVGYFELLASVLTCTMYWIDMFRGRVAEYRLPTPFACFPFTSPPVCRRVPPDFNWSLQLDVPAQ